MRQLLVLSVGFSLLAGCATSQTSWTPTVDTYGSSRAQYLSRDTEECRALAMRSSGSTSQQATEGAVTGGLVGAAGGAALGALLSGRPGRGALLGAATGAVAGGATRASQSDTQFKRSFNNCMRQRGHNVIN